MAKLDWTEWAAIYLAGYNDARRAANPMTPEDLSIAWEGYEAKRPVLTDTHPFRPYGHTLTCPRKDETHAFCPVAQHTRRVRTPEERAMVGDSRPVSVLRCAKCWSFKCICDALPKGLDNTVPSHLLDRCHSCPTRPDMFCHIQCTGD